MPSRVVRATFWMIAIFLGGAQTWFTRHRIFSDGISYLEIARQYATGDWHSALNAYWSPLYSWLIAIYLLLFQPSPYWEVSSLHVINFVAFLGSCWVFEKFLIELTELRSAQAAGLSGQTIRIAGYVAVLHGGLLMVGTGYISPDMVAFLLTGLAGWIVLRIGSGKMAASGFAILGATLGLGYLDRAAFLPLAAVYILAAALLLPPKREQAIRFACIAALCFFSVAAPFAAALTLKQGAITTGESGKLNYGWEVDGAARSIHWRGEPGDIGQPLHPTRLILQSPVPVYEFAEPVGGSYPPWHDPAYWYAGIHPHLKIMEQLRVLAANVRTMAFYLLTTPAFLIVCVAIIMLRGRGLAPSEWPRAYWVLILPSLAGMALYCLVFVDKRYIAGFFAILWITTLAAVEIRPGGAGRYIEIAAQAISILFVLVMGFWLKPAIVMAAKDALSGHEGEYNVSWLMAQRFAALGVKPGDRVAYIGSGISADWARLAGVKIVAEVPVRYVRTAGILNNVQADEQDSTKFFQLGENEREKVYDAFRRAGAVIAVTNRVPAGGTPGDWVRLLDPQEARYPKTTGQVLEQSPGFYRWLNRGHAN